MKRLLAVSLVLVLLAGGILAWIYGGETTDRPRGGTHEVTRNKNKGWVEQMFLREVRAIARSGEGVLIEFTESPPRFAFPGVRESESRRAEGLQTFGKGSGSSPAPEKRGNAFLFHVGSVLKSGHNHGGATYTIRQVLPDRVVIDYSDSHHIMMNSFEDSGTVELAYRTSTPLRTEGQFRDSIAKELAAQVTRIRGSPDGTRIDVEAKAPMDFFIKGEAAHRVYEKKADRIALAIGESFVFPRLHGSTVVMVKRILPDKAELEYRSDHKHEGQDALDTGTLEITYRTK